MAKKKSRKETSKSKFKYTSELVGFIIVLISIIGLCGFGIVGDIVRGFALFLVGSWFQLLLLGLFIIGFYMAIKREMPEFINAKMIGLYLIFIAILLFSHLSYVRELGGNGVDIFKETIDNMMLSLKSVDEIDGGGIIGAAFSFAFYKLLGSDGAFVVSCAMVLFGVILLFNVSIIEAFKWMFSKIKSVFKHEKTDKEAVKEKEENYEKDNKIVVSSVDELIHVHDKQEEQLTIDTVQVAEQPVSNAGYKLPPISLLDEPKKSKSTHNEEQIKKTIEILEKVLADFQIVGKVTEIHVGPNVTQYEMELKSGTKVSKVLSINREIALALSAKDVRIQAPIPGKSTIGIEIPNPVTTMVGFREIISAVPKNMKDSKLLAALGKDIMGRAQYVEINKTPHLLVAGATGSGKSVCINGIICSILMRAKPDEVKLLMVDPKKVELSMYNGVPHLMAPVVTDPKKASIALQKIVSEMENRYDLFSESKTKNIAGYNELIEQKNKNLPDDEKLKKLPYIVVLVDELADLMLVASKEVEDSIMRITQMARAAGIHLIIATQRPSTDVITGVIKANIPSRISFAVSSSIDSRTILDMIGAEKLLGKGDMLFLPMGENAPIRMQGNFISEEEIKRIVDFTIEQQKAKYDERLMELEHKTVEANIPQEEYDDPLYNEIVDYAINSGKISASLIQRKYRLGYNRAARIIDLLEERGIVGPQNGSKPREVLVKLENSNNDE
ncbi:MAG: DNA translocase FtsK [Firmicutes bacterium]|nr:DNA translocase FtsK [Bacillota bacterium]